MFINSMAYFRPYARNSALSTDERSNGLFAAEHVRSYGKEL